MSPYLDYNPEDGFDTWPDGKYAATLENVENTVAKSGKSAGQPMQKLTWRVWRGSLSQLVWENFTINMGWKIGALAKAMGYAKDFKEKTFDPADHMGEHVTLELSTKEQPGYPAKNVVDAYYPDGEHDAANEMDPAEKQAIEDVDDIFNDIPSAFDEKKA